ncbi:MAG TPA: hypothetical protein VJ624_06785, partial [Thermodesulfobacteriota bacterium]|nr:hypothetical protein [Thermodesulfobacteriota bacterium]
PDAHPLDSRSCALQGIHGNDMRSYLTPRLTPPQADEVNYPVEGTHHALLKTYQRPIFIFLY